MTQTTDLSMKSLENFELVMALDSLYPNHQSDLNYTYPPHRLVLKCHTKSPPSVCAMCHLLTPPAIFHLSCAVGLGLGIILALCPYIYI